MKGSQKDRSYGVNENPGERFRKAFRLGKFEAQPLVSITLDLYGLNVKDALEVVQRKINRALHAEADAIRIIVSKDASKVQKALHTYLATVRVVEHFEIDERQPNVTLVYLHGQTPH